MQYQTLLYEVRPEEVAALRREYNLRQEEGYTIIYLTDPDELRRYCFPFGFNDAEKNTIIEKKSKSYIADEQLLLHSLYRHNEAKHIVPTEYFSELRGMIRFSIQHAKDIPLPGSEAFRAFFFKKDSTEYNKSKEFLGNTGEEEEAVESSAEFVSDYFSEVFASVTMLMDGVKKLREVLEKHLVFEDSTDNLGEDIANALAFEPNEPELEEDRLLDRLTKIADRKKLIERTSKRRDVRVIKKLYSANLYALKNNLNIRFLYFTDAETSIQLLDYYHASGDPLFHTNLEQPLYRRRRHMFLRMLCEPIDSTSEVALIHYDEMSKASEYFNELFQTDQFDINKDYLDELPIASYYREMRNRFENENLFRHYQDQINAAKKLAEDYQVEGLIKILEKVFDNKDDIIENLTKFSDRLLEMSIESHFHLAYVATQRKDILRIDISKGADQIAGKYHHLPMLFRLDDQYAEHLDTIVSVISEENITAELLNDLKGVIEALLRSEGSSPEHQLLKMLICLLIKPYSKQTVHQDLYQLSLHGLEQAKEEQSNLTEEFQYLAVWLSRRARKYDFSLQLANEIIEKTSTVDGPYIARFYHGRFLANYCIFLGNKEKKHAKEKITLLKSCIEDIIIALHGYNNLTNESIKVKLIQTLLNSICFLFIELFEVTNDSKYIKDARDRYMFRLKGLAPNAYNRPEYYHTESVLEYYESFYYKDPVKKIGYAYKAIKRALLFENISDDSKEKYRQHKLMVEKRIAALTRPQNDTQPP